MILYHGTDSKNLDGILKHGLLPRKDTGNQVYGGHLASNKNFTYLTRWNPVAHAYSIDENSPVVIKVNVDDAELYPDEDFLERVEFMKTGKPGNPGSIDVAEYKDMWRKSYNMFGNVAIRQVGPDKIIDHVVLDPKDFPYHCGIGAQGNQLVSDMENSLNLIDGSIVKKYIRRFDLLFTKGWPEVKKDILKERPSLTLSLKKPTEKIRVKGKKLGLLFRPNMKLDLHAYICDEWIDNFPIKFPCVDLRFDKLVQLPIDFKGRGYEI